MWSNGYIWTQKYCKYYLKKKKKNHKVHITEGPTTLTAPVRHSKHRWVNVWFPLHWTNWTASSCWLGTALDSHVVLFSPPPTPKECSVRARWLVFDLRVTLLAALGRLPDICSPRPPRESVSPDFIGLVIPSATTSHAATHWVMETMRATDTDIIFGVIRAARLFPHVGADIRPLEVTRWGLRQRNWLAKLQRGPKFPSEGGRNHKSEEPGGVFFNYYY